MTAYEKRAIDRQLDHEDDRSVELPSVEEIILAFGRLDMPGVDKHIDRHVRADALLLALVRRLGYEKIADLYEKFSEDFYYA